MSNEFIDDVEETEKRPIKKEPKKGKWTYDSAIAWLRKNGHVVMEKQVRLSNKAGIGAFGCADYLHNVHKFEVFYSGRD